MIDQRLYEEFRDIGRDIFVTGLTSSHGGNMSVRVGDKIIIKRRGAQFGRLKPTDFVETSFEGKDSGIIRASTELIVHRAIYEQTAALAVIHAHPRTAITLSLSRDEIIPIDNEGSYLLRKIPVVSVEMASGSKEMATAVSEALRGYKIIMQRGHGCFSVGQTLEEAYAWVSALEEVSDIILEHELLGEKLIEYRKHSDSYKNW
ncbi:MAG: class II aldolase/adducin family protein [Chloroflexota bacterium]|jgi:L-fuculose-phosphate aldolase